MVEVKLLVMLTDGARYSENLDELLKSLGGAKQVLRLDYVSDWQGHVDTDVLLNDGRVFTYYYSYGSCSGCDDWDSRGLNDEEIQANMLQEATIFENEETYKKWRKSVPPKEEE